MNASEYYEKMASLGEMKEIINIINKWDKLSQSIETGKKIPKIIPNLLLTSKAGVGKTHFLRLLSEYLYEVGNLMEFHGNVKFFEFMLDYCPPERPFLEIQRIMNDVRNAAGFRNLYRGIVSVDIDEWLGHCEEKNFLSFLEYLASNSNDWLIIFNVSCENKSEIDKLEAILTMFFRLERSSLNLPDTEEMLGFVLKNLDEYKITLDESAKALMYNAIESLRGNKFFDGYKSLQILCQDIAYELYAKNYISGKPLCAEDLVHFTPNGNYIKRSAPRREEEKRIGLI